MYKKNQKSRLIPGAHVFSKNPFVIVIIAAAVFILWACNSSSSSDNAQMMQQPPPSLPVFTVSSSPATTYQEFSASLEGTRDIEIRPQVEGYLDRIFMDEGAYVRKGQTLFQINSRPFL